MARRDKDQNNRGKMSVEEAGRKGGQKTASEHGPEFYEEIGSRGGSQRGANQGGDGGGQDNPGNFANRPKEDVRRAGREGGSK